MHTRTVWMVLFSLVGCAMAHAQSASAPVNVSNTFGVSVSPSASVSSSGTLHVAWADSAGEADSFHRTVRYARSFDGGRVFSASREISGADDGSLRSAREVRIVADRPGEVVIAWWDTTADRSGRTFATVFVAVSHDEGETFGAPLETSLRFPDDVAPKEGFTNLTSLSVALGAGGQIFLLATVQDYYHGFNVYFSRSSDDVTFSGPRRLSSYSGTIPRAATNALVVLPNSQVYAVWTESHGDFVDEIKDMFSVRSTDDGRTFSAPLRVTGARGVTAAVFRDDGSLRLLAQIQKGPRSNHVIRLFASTDGGATFHDRVRLGEAASNSHLNQASIASNGAGTIAVAWAENSSRPGPQEGIYVAVSHDHGRTFETPQRILDGLYPDPPSVTVDAAGRVGVVYTSSELVADDREILFASIEP